ncbi:MAG: hypothetical protein K2L17_03805 [Muribaculaceae bacterium]|nr:hypothetical protein [Muribaculaceae bacterium]
MEQPIIQTKDYTVFESDESTLWALSEFVVTENYLHHTNGDDYYMKNTTKMISNIYTEERNLYNNSRILIVRNNKGEIIGSIRSTLWDRQTLLPLEKLFGINPLDLEFSKHVSSFWHIGRFAINREGSRYSKSILKTLISAITEPVRNEPNGCIIAEVDKKLYNSLGTLGITAHQIAPSIQYLASETIPIYSKSSELSVRYS